MERSKAAELARDAARHAAIERIAAAAPALTAEQLVLLRRVFRGTGAHIPARRPAAA